MAGLAPHRAEVVGRLDDPFTEMVLPETVDHHAREQRIGRRVDHPPRQIEPAAPLVARGRTRAAQNLEKPPWDELAQVLVAATNVDVLVLGRSIGDRQGHSSAREFGLRPPEPSSTVAVSRSASRAFPAFLRSAQTEASSSATGAAPCEHRRRRLIRHPDLVDRDIAAAVVGLRIGPIEVDGPAIADLEVGRMAQPHAQVLRDPAGLVANVDFPRQGPVNRIANLLEAVDNDVDPAALAGDQPVEKRVSIVKLRDRSTPRRRSEITPLWAWPGLSETNRVLPRQVKPQVAGLARAAAERGARHGPAVETVAVEVIEHDLIAFLLRRRRCHCRGFVHRPGLVALCQQGGDRFLSVCSAAHRRPCTRGDRSRRADAASSAGSRREHNSPYS